VICGIGERNVFQGVMVVDGRVRLTEEGPFVWAQC